MHCHSQTVFHGTCLQHLRSRRLPAAASNTMQRYRAPVSFSPLASGSSLCLHVVRLITCIAAHHGRVHHTRRSFHVPGHWSQVTGACCHTPPLRGATASLHGTTHRAHTQISHVLTHSHTFSHFSHFSHPHTWSQMREALEVSLMEGSELVFTTLSSTGGCACLIIMPTCICVWELCTLVSNNWHGWWCVLAVVPCAICTAHHFVCFSVCRMHAVWASSDAGQLLTAGSRMLGVCSKSAPYSTDFWSYRMQNVPPGRPPDFLPPAPPL